MPGIAVQSHSSAWHWLHGRVGPSNSPVLLMGRSAIIHLIQAWRGSWRRFAQQWGPGRIRVLPSIAAAPWGFSWCRCLGGVLAGDDYLAELWVCQLLCGGRQHV